MVVESNGGGLPPQELETFLPQDGKKEKIVTTYNISKDAESADFDPFSERQNDKPTSNMDTLTHLLKASLGTGILAMPQAFKCSGIVLGVFFTVLVAVVCTHCSYILVKCAHVLYKKTRTTKMSFMDVAEMSAKHGPEPLRPYAYAFRLFVQISLFFTYFGTCSVYTVIVATNIMQVVGHHMGIPEEEVATKLDIKLYIVMLLLPLILMVWIRSLKFLAPVSLIANIFMGTGLAITFYYLVATEPLNFENVKLAKTIDQWPAFFSITIFAIEAIGVVMPLENAMKTPRSMLGGCGVLNMGMSGVTLVYIVLGFLGYLRYGEAVAHTITYNLNIQEIPAQIVKVAIALGVYCTFGLQFFVCVDIAWQQLKDRFTKRPDLAEYVIRTVLCTLSVMLAVAVPNIMALMGVIGALCFSLLGLIAPACIELLTFWDIGYGPLKYLVWKNVLVMIFGGLALVFGTKEAVMEILK